MDYAVFLSLLGLLATYLGKTVVDFLVKKYKQDAIVVLLIGAVMAVALALTSVVGVLDLVAGASAAFHPLCARV